MTLVVGINGSPRKGWNTSTLVSDALEGASSTGAETRMVDLYDLDLKGCVSCFGCKRVGLEDHRCYHRDGLTEALEMARGADAIVLGSPIYYGHVTAGMVAFIERLLFPFTTYRTDLPTFCDRPIPTGFIYTMNAGEEYLEAMTASSKRYESIFGTLLRCTPESYCSINTWQYRDYDRYEHSMFDVESKRVQRETQFPKDREACREMGVRLANADRNRR